MLVERVIVVVLDGVGVGALPDADAYGDAGSDTLSHLAKAAGGLSMPVLQPLGLGNVSHVDGVPAVASPRASYGRLAERSPGKDSVTGHWEMMGVVLDRPFPTYPEGFPPDVIGPFSEAIGRSVLGNVPASGTEIIQRLGDEHVHTGKPIVYTSADSVFQIAAHEDVIPVDRLYEICQVARGILTGRHAVGRVIARPFVGVSGAYTRTERRRDFPLDPPPNVIDALCGAGIAVRAIGKIREFFNGRGIARWDQTACNADHIAALQDAARDRRHPFVFANLEDFDMLYGHRNNSVGFASALTAFDHGLGAVLPLLDERDLLILTSDHGNDPTTPSTDHSREHALLIAYAPAASCGVDLGTRQSFADIGATVCEALQVLPPTHGESFLRQVLAGGIAR